MKKLSERLRERKRRHWADADDMEQSAHERSRLVHVADGLEEAACLAEEHEAATGWRPIAEAPKDGSEQVLGGELMGRWNMWLAWWTGGEDEPEWRCSYTGECIPEQYKATHYLPSPPPSETKP